MDANMDRNNANHGHPAAGPDFEQTRLPMMF